MKRLLTGLLVACTLAVAVAVTRPQWSPVCAAFQEGSVEWYMFFCFIDPPPKDPLT
jgi:hypothetical protein